MFTKISLVALGLCVAVGSVVTAQQLIPPDPSLVPPDSSLKFVQVWRPTTTVTGQTQIIGVVIDIRQIPVAHAKVRLRNLNTGRVEQDAETNDKGEYAFQILEPGTFVVEMVLTDGRIIALSNAGALARYETLQTVVQLPGRWDIASNTMEFTTNVSNFVGMSSALTMTAATLTLAVEQNVTPLDAGEPVSP